MHELLLRQLARYAGPTGSLPPEWQPLLDAVSAAYRQADDDRALLEHSMDRTSRELLERNEQLRQENAERARAAVEIRTLNEDLERRVVERTSELSAINAALEHEIAERRQAEEALRRQNEELGALHDTTLGLINRLDPAGLLEAIIVRAAALVGTEHGYLYVLQPKTQDLVVRVGAGCFMRDLGHRIKRGEGVGGRVWATGEPLVVEDYHVWEGRQAGFDHLRAVAAIPLRAGAEIVGVIGLAYLEDGRTFGAAETTLLRRFGQLASLALGNAQIHAAARQELLERRRAEVALRASEAQFRAIFENALDAMFIADDDGLILDANPAASTLFGLPADALRGRPTGTLVPQDQREEVVKLWPQLLREGRLRGELQMQVADGGEREIEYSAKAYILPGCHLLVLHDITEGKRLEQQLAYQAFHDALTGLPNRALFMDRLGHALVRARRLNTILALLFLDLDDFKVINDSLGHTVGDQLLIVVAERIQACVRASDSLARLGGDEFTILLEDCPDLQQAVRVAQCVATQLRAPFVLDGHEVFISTSIGIALSTPELAAGLDGPAELLRDADMAMYQAKNHGKDDYALFDPDMNVRAWQRLQVESDLRRALDAGEFYVDYQPVVDLATGRIVELEAVLRWQHPRQGLLPSTQFIHIAEETGLILALGRWVLVESCRQMRAWQAEYPVARDLLLSVNLSPRQFRNGRLVEEIRHTLAVSGLDAASLKLQVAETAALASAEATPATFRHLKALGVHLAIDNFGPGDMPLRSLKRYPLDTLKLARSFLEGLDRDPGDEAIVRNVVETALALGLTVTAAGIESELDLIQVRAIGCDRGQGDFLAAPLPAEAVTALFAAAAWPVRPRTVLDAAPRP